MAFRAQLQREEELKRTLSAKQNELARVPGLAEAEQRRAVAARSLADFQKNRAEMQGSSAVHRTEIAKLERELQTDPNLREVEERCRLKCIDVSVRCMSFELLIILADDRNGSPRFAEIW